MVLIQKRRRAQMKRIVYGENERFVAWAQERIGVTFRDDAVAIGIEDDSGIRGAVIYDTFTKTDVCIHVASDGSKTWANQDFVTRVFFYPFVTCGYGRVTGLVPESNKEALRLDLHLGFKVEGVCREAAPDGGNIIVLGMLRRECRFIPKQFRI